MFSLMLCIYGEVVTYTPEWPAALQSLKDASGVTVNTSQKPHSLPPTVSSLAVNKRLHAHCVPAAMLVLKIQL